MQHTFDPLRSNVVNTKSNQHKGSQLSVSPKGFPTLSESDPSHPATPGVSGIPCPFHRWRATPPNLTMADDRKNLKGTDRRLKCWKGWS